MKHIWKSSLWRLCLAMMGAVSCSDDEPVPEWTNDMTEEVADLYRNLTFKGYKWHDRFYSWQGFSCTVNLPTHTL